MQEQSDRAVLDSQNKIRQLEAQLADTKNRLEAAQSSRDEQGQLIINLKHDINSLKRNLTQLEEEKDEILVGTTYIVLNYYLLFLLKSW